MEGTIQSIAAFFLICELTSREYECCKHPFDWWGFVAYFISVWSLTIFVTFAHQLNWFTSNIIVCSAVLFAIFFPAFIMQIKLHPYPIFDFSLLRNKITLLGTFQLFNLFFMYYGLLALNVTWLHLDVSYSPYWITYLLVAMVVAAVAIMYLANKLNFSHLPAAQLAGFLILLVSMYLNMTFNSKVNFGRMALERVLAGVGFGLGMPSVMHMTMISNPEDKGLESATLFQFGRMLASGFGLATFFTVWERRTIFYHYRLGSYLTPFSEIVDHFFTWTSRFNFTHDMSKGGLNLALDQQSISLALNDTFFLMSLFCLVSIFALIIFYIRKHWGKENTSSQTVCD